MIDQATADKIINTADIVDVVSEFVTLRRSGANYKGLCPFHNEKTPSFMVSPAKGVCKCFSCGKGGNVVHFLMEHEQFSYPEALRWLAKKYNIEIEEKELTAEQKQAQSERESMFIVNEWARDYFHSNLYNSVDGMAIGMAYFRSRGFRDDIIKKFQLGFSLNSFDALTKEAIAHGFDKKFLLATSICKQKEDGSLSCARCSNKERKKKIRQFERIFNIQQAKGTLRLVSGKEGNSQGKPGFHGRGLHRCDFYAPVRHRERSGKLGHGSINGTSASSAQIYIEHHSSLRWR